MANLNLRTTLQWISAQQYTFELYEFMPFKWDIWAIYFVWKIENNNINILYIWKTHSIEERFNNHHKASDFVSHNANTIWIISISNEYDRDRIERDLIPSYRPILNEQLV